MEYVFEYTSVLTLAQWDSEKNRGVFCDNRAEDYKVWLAVRATLLFGSQHAMTIF